MKKPITFAIVLVAIVATAFAGSARTEIDAWNKKVTAAMMKKDMANLEKIMKAGVTSDFKHVENGQSLNFAQMFERMKMGIGSMKKLTKATTKIVSITEKGNTAVCKVEHVMEGMMAMEDKKDHKMGFTGIAEHTYVKQGKSWKMSKMEWKTQKATMDGKPMDMGGGK